MKSDIRIISSRDIDRDKWDARIERSENGLIYSRSFCLDVMADNWSAVVAGDYRIVMPLTWRSKLGIKYLSKEIFIQQLGVIGEANDAETIDIIEFSLNKFPLYGRVSFNFSNDVAFLNNVKSKTNFVLDLNKTYEEIFRNFVESLQRNIRRAVKNNVHIIGCPHAEAANAYKNYLLTMKNKKDIEGCFARVEKLLKIIPEENIVSKKAVDENGNTLAACLWLKDNKRIYNLMPTTFPGGKEKVAMPFLLNDIIKEHCGQKLLFDFEGSELPGIKKFYEKFSPVNQPFYVYQYNRIPLLRKKL